MGKQSQHLRMQLRASSPQGWRHSPSDHRHSTPRAPRAASEPAYGQPLRHSSGRNRNKCHLCLANVTHVLWEAIPGWSWCWGARLSQPSGTPFSCHCPCHLPFPPAALRGAPVVHCHGGKVWVAWGRFLDTRWDTSPGADALSCSIPGCCNHSYKGSLGCKPHHMPLLQREINQSCTCNVTLANRQTPTPYSQLLSLAIGSIPQLHPCLL